jgi:transporter family-2 protein
MFYFNLMLAFIAGALGPIQGAMNANLGKSLNSSLIAAFISFAVGLLTITMVCLITRVETPSLETIKSTPIQYFLGGMIGAIFVTTVLFLIPKIGIANVMATIITAQLIISVLIDHFGVFNLNHYTMNTSRALGVLLLILGTYLIQKK